MKALLATIILALAVGASMGVAWYRSEVVYDGAMASPGRYVRLETSRGTIAGYEVTFTAKMPKQSKPRVTASVKKAGPQMHCGDWRPLEQGSGNVRECEVY